MRRFESGYLSRLRRTEVKLSKRVKETLSGLKSSRKQIKKCVDAPAPCIERSEVIETSLYEILLTHPDFSWIVTDRDVRAKVSIRDRRPEAFPSMYMAHWNEDLKLTDHKPVRISINQRECC